MSFQIIGFDLFSFFFQFIKIMWAQMLIESHFFSLW